MSVTTMGDIMEYEETRQAYMRQYRQANRERIAQRQWEYRQANRERIAEQARDYYDDHREEILEYNRRRRESGIEVWGRETVNARQIRRQEWTAERATLVGVEWSPAEDAYLLKTWDDLAPVLQAHDLGRTYGAVTSRRSRLRKRGLAPE